jgi:hypothetical protein
MRHHSSSGTTPPSYEEDRDDGEGGTIPPDDNTYVLPLKLSSCRVLLPQVYTPVLIYEVKVSTCARGARLAEQCCDSVG